MPKISQLPAVTTVSGTDLVADVQNSVTSKATMSQVLTYIQTNIQISESQVTNLTTDLASKLAIAQNLADLNSASAARSNLGLGSAAVINVPVSVANGGTGLTTITAHDLLIGNGTSNPNLVAPSATSGVPLISQGASADPTYGTVVVAGGGTGLTTTTAYGLIAGGTTATGNFQNAGTGTSGQVYVSGGNAALGTWTNATGTGNIVKDTSPILTTPTLGVSAATSINFGDTALAKYKQGSWTPALAGSSANPGSITYSFQVGEYTQIGNVVYYYCRVIVSALTMGGAAGQLQITGLPVAAVNSTAYDIPGACLTQNVSIDAGTLFIVGRVPHGQTYLNLIECPTTSTSASTMPITNISSTTDISISGFYFTT